MFSLVKMTPDVFNIVPLLGNDREYNKFSVKVARKFCSNKVKIWAEDLIK